MRKPRRNRFIPADPDTVTGADLVAFIGGLVFLFALAVIFI